MGPARFDDQRAARTHFGERSLDRDLPNPTVNIKNRLDFAHATLD
jgi:hypothetical protein